MQLFEIDSGSGFTLIPENEYKQLNINRPIKKANMAFRSYTGDVFVPIGVG